MTEESGSYDDRDNLEIEQQPLTRPVTTCTGDDDNNGVLLYDENLLSSTSTLLKGLSFLSFLVHLRNEIAIQIKTVFPTLAGILLYKIPWLISLRFVGSIGSTELAAAALAATLCNVTGISLSVGLSSAITTLTSQARGDLLASRKVQQQQPKQSNSTSTGNQNKNDFQGISIELVEHGSLLERKMSFDSTRDGSEMDTSKEIANNEPFLPLVFLFRGIFIQLIFVIPVGIWWINGIESVLIKLGQTAQIASMTEKYLRILTPGLWSYSINWTLTAWLQTIEMADVPAYAAAFGLLTHVPFNYLYVYIFNWGYLGCAAATVTFQLFQPVLMLSYLFLTPWGRTRLLEKTVADAVGVDSLSFWKEAKEAVCSIPGIIQYLGLAIPGIVAISEWWASEVSIFLSGHLIPFPALALGAMTLYQSINTFFFMFPLAFSVSGAARVGTLLGTGDPSEARFAGFVSVFCAGLSSGLIGLILYFTPHTFFPSLFAREQDVIIEASKVIPLLSVYVFADGIQVAFNGIIKGCGRQAISIPVVVIAYWMCAVPLGFYLAFVRNDGYMCDDDYACGVTGLVAGNTIGTCIHMLLLGLVVLCATNWDLESSKAKARLHMKLPEEMK